MTSDYPDWTRLFWLSGVAITIPINIESSDITLPVSIDAATAEVDINIAASDITVDINIAGSDVTLNVNLHAQTANIEIDFADQSVAVFDAAKWFAHEADEVFVTGGQSISQNTATVICSRTVPTGKAFFIGGVNHGIGADSRTPNAMVGFLRVASAIVANFGSYRGTATILDVPIRATAGQLVELLVAHYGSAGSETCYGSFWGYDEDV